MSTSQKSKRAKERNMRQAVALLIAYSFLVRAYEDSKRILQQRDDYEEEHRKIALLFEEMRRKLMIWSHYVDQAAEVYEKVLKGLDVPELCSVIEVFAALMVCYRDEARPKIVSFSKEFYDIVYEIDQVGFDEVGTKSVKDAANIAYKIFDRIMNGDYLEFKVAA